MNRIFLGRPNQRITSFITEHAPIAERGVWVVNDMYKLTSYSEEGAYPQIWTYTDSSSDTITLSHIEKHSKNWLMYFNGQSFPIQASASSRTLEIDTENPVLGNDDSTKFTFKWYASDEETPVLKPANPLKGGVWQLTNANTQEKVVYTANTEYVTPEGNIYIWLGKSNAFRLKFTGPSTAVGNWTCVEPDWFGLVALATKEKDWHWMKRLEFFETGKSDVAVIAKWYPSQEDVPT